MRRLRARLESNQNANQVHMTAGTKSTRPSIHPIGSFLSPTTTHNTRLQFHPQNAPTTRSNKRAGVVGAQPQPPVGLRPLGVLPATTILALMLYKCSNRTFGPVRQQPRLKMHRGAADAANPRIGGYR